MSENKARKRISRQYNKILETENPQAFIEEMKAWVVGNCGNEEQKAKYVRWLENLGDFMTNVENAYEGYEQQVYIANRNLEVSNSELFEVNRAIQNMLNSLDQAYFVFGKGGTCSPIYSAACKKLFGVDPGGVHVAEVLKIAAEDLADFNDWIDLLFGDVQTIPFERCVQFGPAILPDINGRRISIQYKPLISATGANEGVIVVGTDVTEEFQARQEAKDREDFAQMILQINRHRDHFLTFVKGVRSLILELKGEAYFNNIPNLLRELHTLKGAAASFSINVLRDEFHEYESSLTELSPDQAKFVGNRFQTMANSLEAKLNEFLESQKSLLGEDFERMGRVQKIPIERLYAFVSEIFNSRSIEDVRNRFIQQVLATPVFNVLQVYESETHSLANTLGKEIGSFKVVGDDVPIVLENYEQFFSSLIHVFRNMVDHGIESPEVRFAAGKATGGNIKVTIKGPQHFAGRHFAVTIEDDGQGINLDKLRQKYNCPDKSDNEVAQLIFAAGVSTRDQVSLVSGRGIGLDAVKVLVDELGGKLTVTTQAGKGTAFTFMLPYNLEIPNELTAAAS